MKLGVYGAGGLGRELFEIACRRNEASRLWSEIVFVDDVRDEGDYFGTQVINFDTLLRNKADYECVVAVGEPGARSALFQRLMDGGVKVTGLIDPTALISPSAKIGNGSIVCEFSTIHSGVEIGVNALIQPYCDVGHDIKVGNHTVLSPYCAPGGGTVFGERVFAGMQSTFLQKLTIGDDAIISMGSVVFRDVAAGTTVVGNPARVTRGNEEHKVFR